MKKQNQVRPGLPPDARAEILEALGANMEIGRGRYFVLECCRDQRQLQSVQRRIQNQMRGLDATAGKVRVRIRVLDRLKSVLMQGKRRKAG